MARGSRELNKQQVAALVRLWAADGRFGSRHRFAVRFAEILNETASPTDAMVKAADKRLERLEKLRSPLTNATANAIANAAAISREEFDGRLFGRSCVPATAIPAPEPSDQAGEEAYPYRHLEILHEYTIKDVQGCVTEITTAERVEVVKKEVSIGGSYWDAEPRNLAAWLSYPPEGQSPWDYAMPLSKPLIEKVGKLYRWDTFHEPALMRGQIVWFLTRFELRDEFTSNVCRDDFHSYQRIGAFTWRIQFPERRPAKRWWIHVEYHPAHHRTSTLKSHIGETPVITWTETNLPKGVIYVVNWEW